MSAPDITEARCHACGWRRVPMCDAGEVVGWKCPNCGEVEDA
jgi:predicted RNA-binding Zn-ribbon protein involved in translation (DUF1610 family)